MAISKNVRSTTRSSNKTPYGRVTKFHGAYIGVIKDNKDIQRNGRLRVWIPEFGSLPEEETAWRLVNYCSPFGGVTPSSQLRSGAQSPDNTQTSYGMWMIPPDIDNHVIVMFLNGDPARGVWIGCLYEPYMNNMVPGIAASDQNFVKKGKKIPVAEYNKLTLETVNPSNITRPIASSYATAIGMQGLLNDTVRGVTSSSARREVPSQVYGITTPGPKNPKSTGNRLGGNQFVMDDGENSEYIGFKTRSGASVKIDETNGLIYVINKKGTAWFQFDDDGHIDMFGADSIAFRSKLDVNIRADRDLNFEAGRNINIKAAKDWIGGDKVGKPSAGQGGNINIEANNNLILNVLNDKEEHIFSNYKLSVDKDHTVSIKYAKDVTVGTTSKEFAGESMDFLTETFRAQSNIGMHLNGGLDMIGTATLITWNGATAEPAQKAMDVSDIPPMIPMYTKTNVLSTFGGGVAAIPTISQLYQRDTESMSTTIPRLMTYEPCPEHINKGTQN